MNGRDPGRSLTAGDLYLLAYALHMAETARSDAARLIFETFVQQERRRLEAKDHSNENRRGMMKKVTGSKEKQVEFEVSAKPGSAVFVAGSFNNWNPRQQAMRDNPESGIFKATLTLPPGRHEYKFVVNGAWLLDPKCPDSLPNNQGSRNSVIGV